MKRKLSALFCVFALLLAACAPKPALEPQGDVEPAAPETVPVTVFVPDEQAEFLEEETVGLPEGVEEVTPEALLDALQTAGVLPEGVEVQSCEFSDDGKSAALDLNQAFIGVLESSGSAGEAMVLYAVVNTFLSQFDTVEKLVLTVDGGAIETGHGLYDMPFTGMKYLKE